jgi:nicotinamidase-related amidase
MTAKHRLSNLNLRVAASVCLGLLVGALPVKSALASENVYPAETTAVILVDPYNDFISEGGKIYPRIKETADSVNLVDNLVKLVDGARSKGIPVFYAMHLQWKPGIRDDWQFLHYTQSGQAKYEVFAEGTWGADYHPALVPKYGDVVVQQHPFSSGFASTDLDAQLRARGYDHVVIAGLATNSCVEATGRYATELKYHTTFIKDGVATFSMAEQEAAINLDFPRIAHAVLTVDEFLASVVEN